MFIQKVQPKKSEAFTATGEQGPPPGAGLKLTKLLIGQTQK